MKPALALILPALLMTAPTQAEDITYAKHVRPLWEAKCMACHGERSPYLAEFLSKKEHYTQLSLGPRMDSYPALVMYVGWPDSGAFMRRLDDGKSAKNGKPGNMYVHLGADEAERQKNLGVMKAWVGEGGWVLSKFKDLTRDELGKMKVKE